MYYKDKAVFKILDDIMGRPDIKHKGKAIRNALKRLPVVDAVEPCRCDLSGVLKWAEDFCSDGDKKEGDEDV